MNEEQINQAARLLMECWRGDRHLDGLPAEITPLSLEDGYAIQARLAELRGAPMAGWKIAATSEAGLRHIDVDHPLIGRLFDDRVYASPAMLMMRHNGMRVAEAEFCFRFGRDLPNEGAELTRDEVMDRVDALFPAIEVPDSRFADFVTAGAPALIADNACGREFVLGAEVTGRWRDIAFNRFAVTVYRNGEAAFKSTGADVLGDPRDALTWLVNEARRRGLALKSGHIVTTGVLGRPLAVEPGDRVRADFGVLGAVELAFAAAPVNQNT
jgi:2-keto-4-pentenoate hydratase